MTWAGLSPTFFWGIAPLSRGGTNLERPLLETGFSQMSSIVTAFEEIHMKGRFVALFVTGALASAAYAQSVSERTGVNAALGITLENRSDRAV